MIRALALNVAVAAMLLAAFALVMSTVPARAAQCGPASWYGGKHHGRLTASEERFDQNAMTAAHMTLPFGTVLNVRNVQNGRIVQIRVTDRGDFAKHGRILDMSKASFAKLAHPDKGVIVVCLERVR